MEIETAVTGLFALAHEGRLSIFKMLVQAGPEGMAAGDIARRLDVPANTLSAYLKVLQHADLIASRRDGRSIVYRAQYDAMATLLAYLMEDCCQGHPEVCAPLAEAASRAACCDTSKGARS